MPGKDEEFYLGNSFALEVDSVAVALFTEVSGLESATDVTEIVQQMKDVAGDRLVVVKELAK